VRAVDLATRASIERTFPVGVGLLAGVVGYLVAADRAGSGFFSTSAQIVPVLLLALVLEVRLFSAPRRVLAFPAARRIELGRRGLEAATVVALLGAEAQSLWRIQAEHGVGDPGLTTGGLAWGFVAIAAIAFVSSAPGERACRPIFT
jgi:hypothetical protein